VLCSSSKTSGSNKSGTVRILAFFDKRFLFVLDVVVLNLLDEGRSMYSSCKT